MNRLTYCALVLSVVICACVPAVSPLKDGEYYGYEFMCNLSPSEDPDASWYYSNVLSIKQGVVSLRKAPTYLSRGSVVASVSDGGFPEFDGRIDVAGRRTIVRLRKVSCDYCLVLLNDPLPSKIEREYVIRFIGDGSFELDRVVYRAQPDPELEWKPE